MTSSSLLPNKLRILALSIVLIILALSALRAQAPTSFTYPTPVVYIANVSNVFLSPNVAGSVTSYSMPASPALPPGLSFNTNTGVISGIPTVILNATDFTVTAHNASGSTNATFKMTVTSNSLDNNYNQIHFGGTGVTREFYPAGSNGQTAGNIVVYKKITTISGQDIDCIVTTKAVTNVSSWQAYDQNDASGANFSSNSPDYFAPQISFGNDGGSIAFDFQFILANTYNSTTQKGTNVVLQNVKVNTYDIDGNGGNGANQYNEFGGFSSSELGNPSPTVAATYNPATGLTKFRSTSNQNVTTVTEPKTRVRVTYNNMSNFSIVVGAEGSGAAYFFLDFSSGPSFSSTVTTTPSVDLNTDIVGVTNDGAGCGTLLSFTPAGQTNVAANTNLTELTVTYLSTDITNGAHEALKVNSSINYALNASDGALGNVTVGGITYVVAKSSSGTSQKISFKKNGGGEFTVAQAEAVLDAFQYSNEAPAPTAGERKFNVNILNTTFKSPDAVFTATVNCVSISGHIWRDANGLLGTTDFNTISANSPAAGQFAADFVYAILVDPVTNKVIDSKGIETGGAFSFGTVSPGTYILYVSNAPKTKGDEMTAATLPLGGYVFMGENLGAGAGSDLSPDGKLTITVGSTPVTDANFGLNIAPLANDVTELSQTNPDGTVTVAVPTLNGSDPEQGTLSGNGNTIKIIDLPTNATLYYNGSPVSLDNPVITNYNPIHLRVDPNDGSLTVVFHYQEVDAAGLTSPTATVTMPFTISNLPVTLVGFTARQQENEIVLSWKTVAESDFSHFELQRAADAKIFSTIVSIKGTNAGAYSHIDKTPLSGYNYYRLKMVDTDGTFAFSRTISVRREYDLRVNFYPNPVSDRLNIEVTDWNTVSKISLSNTAGQNVHQSTGNLSRNSIDVKSLPTGTYIIQVVKTSGEVVTKKISVMR